MATTDLQKTTDKTAFKPTPKMQLWLDACLEIANDSPTAVAEKSGIARETWYDWNKLPGFEDWFYGEYKKLRRRWLPKLDAAGLRFAMRSEKGYQHWKDLREAAGDAGQVTGPSVKRRLVAEEFFEEGE